MKHNTSRIIIETMVRKAIGDIQDSPKRSMRNLVDMALNFSDGRFQQRFFTVTQTMLKNENSPYYELTQNAVGHVDTERLVRFGVNLGYNGCTRGAKVIRETEAVQGYHVPWMLTLHLAAAERREQQYQRIISEGEKLGIYTWQLFAEQAECVLSLAAEHPESAFILYCCRRDVSERFLDEVSELDNLMLAVRYEENAEELCRALRERNLLYSVYAVYSAVDADLVLSDDLFYALEQCSPLFAALVPSENCPVETREAVTAHIRCLREEQRFPLLPWEAISDCLLVDGIISGSACVVTFDAEGYLHICDSGDEKTELNCFEDALQDIFRQMSLAKRKGGIRCES